MAVAGGDAGGENDELPVEAYAVTDEPDEWLENEEAEGDEGLAAGDAFVAIDPDGVTSRGLGR